VKQSAGQLLGKAICAGGSTQTRGIGSVQLDWHAGEFIVTSSDCASLAAAIVDLS